MIQHKVYSPGDSATVATNTKGISDGACNNDMQILVKRRRLLRVFFDLMVNSTRSTLDYQAGIGLGTAFTELLAQRALSS